MNDLRFAVRQLRYAPAFTVTALATIAICLGANLAIFAVIDAILLRPLPFPQSDRLVAIFNTYPKAGVERDGSSLTNYYERRGNIPAFLSLSIFRYASEVIGETGSTQQEKVMRISPDFFTTLGSGPVMGRSFDEAETITPIENHGAAILTDAYWRQRLNSDPHVLGRDIRVNGAPRKIVGVLPDLPAVHVQVAATDSAAAPFRRRRHSHDCAIETGRDGRRSTITDRRAQRRRRKR